MTAVRRLLDLQPVRFLLSGGLVAVVSLSLTTGLSAAGLPFQLALLISYATGVSLHFILHRRFTFASANPYALRPTHQAGRFVAVVLAQYAFLAGGVALVTSMLDVSSLLVCFGLVALLSIGNFLFIGARVFHTQDVV